MPKDETEEKKQAAMRVSAELEACGFYYYANKMRREHGLQESLPGQQFPKGPDSNGVCYFHDYYPLWTGKEDMDSERILDLKKYSEVSIYDFAFEIMSVINAVYAAMQVTDFDIVTIPCHKPGMVSFTEGCIEQLRKFASSTKIRIHTDRMELYRKYEIPESGRIATEERPGYWNQYRSIGLKTSGKLQTKERRGILLLDDIVTTGAHMRACRKLLEEAGINREDIICLAWGKTIG